MSETKSKLPQIKVRPDRLYQLVKVLAIWSLVGTTFCWTYYTQAPSATKAWRAGAMVFGAIALVTFVIATTVYVRQFRRLHTVHDQALEALARGELQTARDAFLHCAERSSSLMLAAISRHNVAWSLLRLGEAEQAVVVLQELLRLYGTQLRATRMHATSLVNLAFDQALLGDLTAAEQSFALADESAVKGRVPSFPAMRAFTRAVIDCRSGNHAAAATALDEGWAGFEVALTGETLRPMRVVRAFAHSAAGPREAGIAAAHLDGLRPAFIGELNFLGVAWPEMAQFLASHQLSRAGTTTQ